MTPEPRNDFPVNLARESVFHFLSKHAPLPIPETIPHPFGEKSAVFVTLMDDGSLRGCVGTILPKTESAAAEIIHNAVLAATQDPRFPPVALGEAGRLSYSVDLISPLEPVTSVKDLDPKIYGVYVCAQGRCGLLLPDLEGIHSVEEQLSIAREKAGILSGESAVISRFTVDRYGKP